jgi:hypothetical protein
MSEFSRQHLQTARRQYTCDDCRRPITPAEQYVYVFARIGTEHYCGRYHVTCYPRMFNLSLYPCPGLDAAIAAAQSG